MRLLRSILRFLALLLVSLVVFTLLTPIVFILLLRLHLLYPTLSMFNLIDTSSLPRPAVRQRTRRALREIARLTTALQTPPQQDDLPPGRCSTGPYSIRLNIFIRSLHVNS